MIFDPLPVAMPVSACSSHVDFLLELGQAYRYAKDVDLAARRVEFAGPFVDYALSKDVVRIKSNAEILEWVRNPVPL